MSIKQKDEIVDLLLDKIHSTKMESDDKSAEISHLAESMTAKGMDTKKIYRNLTKFAISDDAIDTVLKLADTQQDSTAVKYVIKNLDKYNAKKTINTNAFTNIAASDNISDNDFKKIVNFVDNFKVPPEGDYSKYERLLSVAVAPKLTSSEESADYAINFIMNNPKIDPQLKNRYLLPACSGSALVSGKTKVAIFNGLDPENPPKLNFSVTHSDLSKDIVNSPEVINNTPLTSWKFGALSHCVDQMDNANANLMLDKSLDNAANPNYRDAVLMQAAQYNKGDGDKIKALSRKLTPTEWNLAFNKMGHMDEAQKTSFHHILPALAEAIDAVNHKTLAPDGDNLTIVDEQHHELIDKTLNLLGKYTFRGQQDNVNNLEAKKENFTQCLDSIISYNHNLLDNFDYADKRTRSTGDVITSLNRLNRFVQTNSEWSDSAVKLSDMHLKTVAYLDKLSVKNEVVRELAQKYTNFISLFAETTPKISTDEWNHVLDSHPNMLGHLISKGDKPIGADLFSALNTGDRLNNMGPSDSFKLIKRLDKNVIDEHGPKMFHQFVDLVRTKSQDGGSYLGEIHELSKKMKKQLTIVDIEKTAKGELANNIKSQMASAGVGGKEYADHLVKELTGLPYDALRPEADSIRTSMRSMVKCQDISPKSLRSIAEWFESNSTVPQFENSLRAISENQSMDPELSTYVYDNVDPAVSPDIISNLKIHPKVDRGLYEKLYDQDTKQRSFPGYFKIQGSYPPTLENPVHGYDKVMKLDRVLPEGVVNVDQDKLIRTVEEPSKIKSMLSEMMNMIPPEGITWKELKTKNPKFDNIPEVRKFASSRPKILPEDVAEEISKHKGTDYMVTYTSAPQREWDMQKHNPEVDKGQFCVQLNNSQKIEDEIAKDPKFQELYRYLQKSANHIEEKQRIGLHPVTPFGISWARVDTTGGDKGWVIEELQSDFEHYYISSIDHAAAQLSALNDKYTPEFIEEFKVKVKGMVKGWEDSQLEAVEQLAKAHGVESLFLHGYGSRCYMSNYAPDSDIPHGFRDKYEKFPKKKGFEECDYNEYPNNNPDFSKRVKQKGFSTKCWKKKISNK